ncbi:MAG: hypothetical protein GXY74_07170 [Phycisphaerae bacterium]|nr:hypothetical protein [Phycisphaerae bacterium]
MEIDELKKAHADCVGAAAGAAWRTLGVAVAITVLTGLVFLAFRFSEAFRGLLLTVWGTDYETAHQVLMVSVGLMKLIAMVCLLGCVFASSLAKRLRAAYKV